MKPQDKLNDLYDDLLHRLNNSYADKIINEDTYTKILQEIKIYEPYIKYMPYYEVKFNPDFISDKIKKLHLQLKQAILKRN